MSLIQTKSYKLAVVLPGRLETKDYIHIKSHVAASSELGFYAVALDPPGSWESPGTIEDYTVTNYLNAVKEVIEYYGNKPTLLVGHSLGGSIAALAAESNPHVTAFVGLMSLASGPRVTEDSEWKADGRIVFFRDLPPGDHHTAKQKQYDLPYSYFEDALTHDSRAALQTCTKPKLFITGKNDTQNGTSQPTDIYATIREPKQLVELDSPHSYRYSESIINQVNALLKQFVKELPPMQNRTY